MNVSLKVEGGRELAQALSQLSARVSKKVLIEALLAGAELIRAKAAQLAPRDPGQPDLADHLVAARVRDRDGLPTVAIGTTRPFFYDYFQEFGTPHHPAQPFYRPAFEGEAPRALGVIGQEIWRQLAGRGIARPTVDAPTRIGGGLI